MIRVLIDTGIVVSAAFRDRVPEQFILFISKSLDHEWVVSPAITGDKDFEDATGLIETTIISVSEFMEHRDN